MKHVTQQDIFKARRTIAGVASHTPLVMSEPLSEHVGKSVHLKLDFLQPTGAFKVRGAANKILNLSSAERERGVIAVSTGNHGRAVAYVARQQGIRATICVSSRVPQNKITALEQTGAQIVVYGDSQDDAFERAYELIEQYGYVMIPPFDDPYIIAGQGTIGLELLMDAPQIDTVLVPLSGGGLISGIALAVKSANPNIRVIGISMERAAVMHASLQAGKPVALPEEDTLADSLLGGIGLDNQYTFRMVRDLVDDVVLVAEEAIAAGMRYLVHEHNIIVEGASAVGVAALLENKVPQLGDHIAVALCGQNVDIAAALKIAQEQTTE